MQIKLYNFLALQIFVYFLLCHLINIKNFNDFQFSFNSLQCLLYYNTLCGYIVFKLQQYFVFMSNKNHARVPKVGTVTLYGIPDTCMVRVYSLTFNSVAYLIY